MQKESCLLGCLKENEKVVNKNKCHPELDSGSHLVVLKSGEIPYQVRNDKFIKGVGPVLRPYGAPLRSGFTLIELLVVVLIIGILAAVALPQYKIAVAKARMTQLVTLANSVVQAQERYYLANGQYATDWTELDIDIAHNQISGSNLYGNAGWSLNLGTWSVYAYGNNFLPDIFLIFAYSHQTAWASNRRACYATATNLTANAVCKNATGKKTPDGDSGYGASNIYYFQ